MRIPRDRVKSTTRAITPSTISVAIGLQSLSFRHECRGAVDLHDLDARARLEGVVLVVGAGSPHVAADLHLAAVAVHALDDRRRPAHQGGRARPEPRGGLEVPA